MSLLRFEGVFAESLEPTLLFLQLFLLQDYLDLFFFGQVTLSLGHFELAAAELVLSLLETPLNEFGQVDCALLDLLQRLAKFLLLA